MTTSTLNACITKLRTYNPIRITLKIRAIRGSLIEAEVPWGTYSHQSAGAQTTPLGKLSVGSKCRIISPGQLPVAAEIVALQPECIAIMALAPITELPLSATIELSQSQQGLHVPVGTKLLGRVLDSLGQPLDEAGPLQNTTTRSIHAQAPHVLKRKPITEIFSTGIASIDTLLTIGKGQRIGIFAGAGVGKSTLLSMLARHNEGEVTVAALIGERGREVNEFLQQTLTAKTRKQTVVVVASAADPPLRRVRAAYTATAIAEAFRAEGKAVVLIVDSLTRLAYAQRELGLLRGEPPVSRGYPPSVFTLFSELLERAGTSEHGSITAFYNVLVEGDELSEPISDAVRGILDGHIILDRKLAENGHFPAINIPQSISRLMHSITSAEHRAAAGTLRSWLAHYDEMATLVNMGAYVKGSDPRLEQALAKRPATLKLLQQAVTEKRTFATSLQELLTLCGNTPP